jgi:predicted permease
MSAIHGVLHRLRVLVDPEGYAREVEREIRFHLDREAMHRRDAGLTDDAAALAARRRFGNVTYVREEVRRMTGMDWMDRVRQNVGYAMRGLRQSPGFTAAVVLTLALGLGVNAAMFTLIDQIFVRAPAGVANPNEVRRLYASLVRPKEATGRMVISRMWYPDVRAIRRVDSTTVLGLYRDEQDSVLVKVGDASFGAQRSIADADYFRVLGVRPQLGRFFDADEDNIANPAAVAVISHAMWQRVFAGNPRVVGSVFYVKYRPITVIGVAADGFRGIDMSRVDFWIPFGNAGSGTVAKSPWYDAMHGYLSVVTRFKDAASEQRFLDIASRTASGVKIAFMGDSIGEIRSGPIQASLGPGVQGKEGAISIRLAGVALIVLLITLANVSNLLLVRATRREREIAIRRALGVTRRRLFEQLLTESVLLAIVGGVIALLLAIWAGSALRALLLPEVRWPTGVLDMRVAVFAAVAALLTGICLGLAPAIHAWRPDLIASLRTGGKSGTYRRSTLRTGLLVAQAALSVVLLVGGGLFVRSLRNVESVDVGFDFYRVNWVRIVADTGSLKTNIVEAMPALLERIARIPGVESVAAADAGPMLGERGTMATLPGHDSLPKVFGTRFPAQRLVTPGYFRTIGQRILTGREFIAGDPPSMIVSREMAEAYWPGESPLGKCIIVGEKTAPCRPVIGVTVTTNRMAILKDLDRIGQMYTNARTSLEADLPSSILVRTSEGSRARVAALLSAEVKRLVPRAMVVQLRTLDQVHDYELRPWRLGATLFTAMGVLALIVASVGVYSVIAYATSQRTNEMGIRIALGAKLTDIARLVVGDGLRTVAVGIVVGVVLAIAAGKLVASLLYGISPRDPVIMASAAVILALIGMVACVIPAIRAARVDPVSALRAD